MGGSRGNRHFGFRRLEIFSEGMNHGAIMSLGVATANSVLVVTFARNNLGQGLDPLTASLQQAKAAYEETVAK